MRLYTHPEAMCKAMSKVMQARVPRSVARNANGATGEEVGDAAAFKCACLPDTSWTGRAMWRQLPGRRREAAAVIMP